MKIQTIKKLTAYTMIELVVVIVITGILAAVGIPKFFKADPYEQMAFYNEALGTIRYAQKMAIGMGCEVQVSHTSNSISLNIRSSCTTGAFTQAVQDPITKTSGYTKTAPNGVSISSSGFPIYFDRLGRSRNSGGNVANTSMQVGTKSITIIGETGYAQRQ